MKIPASNLKLIVIFSIIVVLGIAGGFSLYGILFPAKDLPSVHSSSPGDHLVQGQKVIDTNFEIQEWNLSKVHKMNMTMILLNRDDFADFPEFERSMQGVNNDPAAWNYGSRVVTWFPGNESDLYRFYDAACKNKTRAECFPSSPVFEYHGQYYTIFSDRMGSHRLAGCEQGNYNCTG